MHLGRALWGSLRQANRHRSYGVWEIPSKQGVPYSYLFYLLYHIEYIHSTIQRSVLANTFGTAQRGIPRARYLTGGVRSGPVNLLATTLQLGGVPYRELLFFSFGEITTPTGGSPTLILPRW